MLHRCEMSPFWCLATIKNLCLTEKQILRMSLVNVSEICFEMLKHIPGIFITGVRKVSVLGILFENYVQKMLHQHLCSCDLRSRLNNN